MCMGWERRSGVMVVLLWEAEIKRRISGGEEEEIVAEVEDRDEGKGFRASREGEGRREAEVKRNSSKMIWSAFDWRA